MKNFVVTPTTLDVQSWIYTRHPFHPPPPVKKAFFNRFINYQYTSVPLFGLIKALYNSMAKTVESGGEIQPTPISGTRMRNKALRRPYEGNNSG